MHSMTSFLGNVLTYDTNVLI